MNSDDVEKIVKWLNSSVASLLCFENKKLFLNCNVVVQIRHPISSNLQFIFLVKTQGAILEFSSVKEVILCLVHRSCPTCT